MLCAEYDGSADAGVLVNVTQRADRLPDPGMVTLAANHVISMDTLDSSPPWSGRLQLDVEHA